MELRVVGEGGVASDALTVCAAPGETLLSALRAAGVAVESPCGGNGTCGKCAVEIRRGQGGWERALACQTPAEEGMEVRIPHGPSRLQVEDGAALAAGGRRFACDEARPGQLGVAVDLGTTTIAAYLHDLSTGEVLARAGRANPQASFGADVISRIHACSQGELDRLQSAAASCLAELAEALCRDAGADASRIARWAVAGNTVMQHILCGLSPESIGVYPFSPLSLFGERLPIPQVCDSAYLCPCMSGYVGGDIAAGIVACGLDELVRDPDAAPSASGGPAASGGAPRPGRNVLFADLGTNGEMALVADGELLCCATATGPAFEGANISQGMQAKTGAIDSCRFEDGAFSVTAIGNAMPAGICGSGLIDALAACLQAGIVDETGRLLPPDELPADRAPLVGLRDGKPAALLVPDGSVALTQKDVRALQLAKAAVSAGISTLLDRAGISLSKVDEFVIGGAFGTHMRAESAAAIGLIPAELLPRVRMVGNCAGAGACAALLSAEARDRMAFVAKSARYIELSLDEGFSEAYIDAMEF